MSENEILEEISQIVGHRVVKVTQPNGLKWYLENPLNVGGDVYLTVKDKRPDSDNFNNLEEVLEFIKPMAKKNKTRKIK